MPVPNKRSRYAKRRQNAPVHPYVEFEGTPLWRVTEIALSDLERNRDLELKGLHQHIVGYLCKQLVNSGFITGVAKKKAPAEKGRAAKGTATPKRAAKKLI